MLIQITAPYFTAGLELKNGLVFDAAPILRWMIGKQQNEIQNYCRFKGWKFEMVKG